jgi:hypothetical protein
MSDGNDLAKAGCTHDVRLVRADAGAVFCGTCGAALEPTAEDLRRLAESPPEPAHVPYDADPRTVAGEDDGP